MKRKAVTVTLTGATETTFAKYAWNSAIRASEKAVGDAARALGVYYYGDKPQRVGTVYTRVWRGAPGIITVTVVATEPQASAQPTDTEGCPCGGFKPPF